MGAQQNGSGPMDTVSVGGQQRSIYSGFAFQAWTEVATVTSVRLHSMASADLIGAADTLFWGIASELGEMPPDAIITGGSPFALLDGLFFARGVGIWVYNGVGPSALLSVRYDPVYFQNIQ